VTTPDQTCTAYLAADGYEQQLIDELRLLEVNITDAVGRLFITAQAPVSAAWSLNTWFDAEIVEIASIGDAAKQLRARQRNWACYDADHRGRSKLITEKLPYLSFRALELGESAPTSPLGSFTLLTPTTMLLAGNCSSPFPNGQPTFVEDRLGPPNRAYLKLWESLALLRRTPAPGERCLDLGASPGGWTWTLAKFGATVHAIDRSPLDPKVTAMRNVTFTAESAFGLDPRAYGRVEWLCSDVIGYPDRILRMVTNWYDYADTMICTIKLQGETDHESVQPFKELPGGRVIHLAHNKHELTFIKSPATSQ
jgi:23S rRNA (cytidine2498-2'-O)-methyltransferase